MGCKNYTKEQLKMTQRVGKKNKNYLLNTLLIIFKIYVLSEPLTYIEAVKFIEYN